MCECTVNHVKAFLVYSLSIGVGWVHEGCGGWYPYNAATGDNSPVPPGSICGQERAIDWSFITHKVRVVSVKVGKSRLMTKSEARSAVGEAAGA